MIKNKKNGRVSLWKSKKMWRKITTVLPCSWLTNIWQTANLRYFIYGLSWKRHRFAWMPGKIYVSVKEKKIVPSLHLPCTLFLSLVSVNPFLLFSRWLSIRIATKRCKTLPVCTLASCCRFLIHCLLYANLLYSYASRDFLSGCFRAVLDRYKTKIKFIS